MLYFKETIVGVAVISV